MGEGRNSKGGLIAFSFSSGRGCLRVKVEPHPARAFPRTDVAFSRDDVNTAAAFLERAARDM